MVVNLLSQSPIPLAWGQSLKELCESYFIEKQNLRFQGQYLDRETGLHYNTFRFYGPDIGRYTPLTQSVWREG